MQPPILIPRAGSRLLKLHYLLGKGYSNPEWVFSGNPSAHPSQGGLFLQVQGFALESLLWLWQA